MIVTPKKNLTLVIYEDQKMARCFQINKGQIKFLGLSIPFITFFSIAAIFFLVSYIKNLRLESRPLSFTKTNSMAPSPQQSEVKKINQELKQQIEDLQKTNADLLQKLQAPEKLTSPLTLFAPTVGTKNLLPNTLLEIKNLKVNISGKSLILNFDLVNSHPEQSKLSGHIFVFMNIKNQVTVFPQVNLNLKGPLLDFSQGETFTVTRFRPVEANFPATVSPTSKDLLFKVLVFSKAGDLLLQQTVRPQNP